MAKPGPKQKEANLDLEKIEHWAELGCTEEAISRLAGYSPTYWYELKTRIPEIAEAVKRGRAKDQERLLSKLTILGNEGNVTALLFALKAKHQFRDSNSTMELTGPGGTPLQVEHNLITPQERRAKLEELKKLEAIDVDEE